MSERYHHGDLPNVLRAAAAEVITEKGVGGFTLREVARRAGVSHAAPAHHFGDSQGLLTSLAVQAFEHLAEQTAAAGRGIDDPAERLVAIGKAYVETGASHPAHSQIAFRLDLVDATDPAYEAAGAHAYAVLADAVQDVADRYNPQLDVARAANLCWSTMQGLLVLYPNIVRLDELDGRTAPPIADVAEQLGRLIVDGLTARRS